jgi:hypothetical protein
LSAASSRPKWFLKDIIFLWNKSSMRKWLYIFHAHHQCFIWVKLLDIMNITYSYILWYFYLMQTHNDCCSLVLLINTIKLQFALFIHKIFTTSLVTCWIMLIIVNFAQYLQGIIFQLRIMWEIVFWLTWFLCICR